MTDFRDLRTELEHAAQELELAENALLCSSFHNSAVRAKAAAHRARAALAQPEPLAATDEALASFTAYFCRNYPGPDTIIHRPEWHAPKIFRAAADAIARWGTPTTPRGTH